jgi:disulfide oxidoreductase YuzD
MREWLSEAVLVHRAVPDQQLRMQYIVVDNQPEHDIDVYYVRVAQENQQWAWSSPIWVPRVGS